MTTHDDVSAVVVHHRHLDVVFETIDAIVQAGVPAEKVVVVDTSEDTLTSETLRGRQGAWTLLEMENRGYGAAVNHAVAETPSSTPFTVVLTHEARCTSADLTGMLAVLRSSPKVAVAGPDTLLTEDGIWSRGGCLTRWLRLPRHRTQETPAEGSVTEVDWVDGALAVYRTQALRRCPFREDFFLYMEETELHSRMRACGWSVVTASGTVASQSTSGMPAYWGVRNTFIFQAAHGTVFSRAVAPPYVFARTCLEMVVTGRWRQVLDAARGFRDGLRIPAGARRHR